jgi:DNA-binding XRE family transcriptional regulator
LFQFRINAQSGYRVKASVQTLLKVCGEDLTQARSSKKRSELKRRLSEALDTLDEDYGIRVHAEQVHMDHTWGLEYSTWKNRVAHFDPPPAMDHRLFGDAEGEPPPLPDVAGDWTPKQIRHLRTKLLEETQAELSKRLGVTKQLISQLENGRKNPSTRIQKALDVLQARFE